MNNHTTGAVAPLAICLALLNGCAGSAQVIQPDHYVTRVGSDNAKRFEFGIRQQVEASTLRNIRDGQTQAAGNRFDRQLIEDSIAAWMQTDGFCLQGFFIYDQRYDGSMYLVLGECREAATQ